MKSVSLGQPSSVNEFMKHGSAHFGRARLDMDVCRRDRVDAGAGCGIEVVCGMHVRIKIDVINKSVEAVEKQALFMERCMVVEL